ncbi:MAG: hypothetical protein AAF429_13720 [Pseudomonadota bacterium]
MQILNPQDFLESDAPIGPYAPIVDGFCMCFDKKAVGKGSSVLMRKEMLLFGDEGVKPALVLDGAHFADEWCGLEFHIKSDFQKLALHSRFYPMQHLYPRLYTDDAAIEFDQLDVSDTGGAVIFDRAQIDEKISGDFKGGNLAFMLPSALWFTIALFNVELNHG